jgi:hypothetical protein
LIVIASEAKQSRGPEQQLDCFVADFIIGPANDRTRWLLAMTNCTVCLLPDFIEARTEPEKADA